MGNSKSSSYSVVPKMSLTCNRKRKRQMSKAKLLSYKDNQNGEGGKQKCFSLDISDRERPFRFCRKHTRIYLENGSLKITKPSKEVVSYCIPLITAQFVGQTTSILKTDEVDDPQIGHMHLGECLRMVDGYIRQFTLVSWFTGKEDYYLKLLSYVSKLRRMPDESEDECYGRLCADSERFVKILHRRGTHSQELKDHVNYWGSRQQLLSSKVITDWVDRENGPLDPIFGALLQPTTGRAGPGDSGWFHEMMFDDKGHVAYHSAVHDAFGYLHNFHGVGPGYDYMCDSYLGKENPLAGQFSGMNFWKRALVKKGLKQHFIELSNNAFLVSQLGYDKNIDSRSNSIF